MSRCLLQKKVQRNYYGGGGEDHLSQLPDEIISKILSQLTLFDACRTGVVSCRLEKLWLSRYSNSPNLIFSHDYEQLEMYFQRSKLRKLGSWPFSIVDRKRHIFVGLLNKVFKSYQQPVLDEFVINFYLNSDFSSVIDDWIKFAFSKGVKRLQLDFSPFSTFLEWETPYAFPKLSTFPNNNRIHNLRDVCLKHVYIDQEAVDALLSACPLLEHLSLQPENVLNLTIAAGQTLKLKHLEMNSCCSAERIEISAPNLISLSYSGRVRALRLKYVPLLSEFHAVDSDWQPFLERIDPHFSYLFQLKNLKLVISDQMVRESVSYPTSFPEFVKLEQLEVKLEGFHGHSLLWPTLLIKASPMLHTFSVKSWVMSTVGYGDMEKERHSERDKRRMREATKFSHQSLKVVKMRAFKGLSCEMELVQHLFDIGAQSLEKAVIDVWSPYVKLGEVEAVRNLARSLGKGLDPRVQFVVI